MAIGRLNKYVTLARSPQTPGDSDGFEEALTPADAWVSITPQLSPGNDRSTEHVVEMRFHPQVTLDTVITYVDPVLARTRKFYARAVQNVNEGNDILRLITEEVQP